MARKPDHKCIVCGAAYHSCDTCERIRSYTPWRTICDTFDHYRIYLAIRGFQVHPDTKESARAELKRLDVTRDRYRDWPEGTRQLLDQILMPDHPESPEPYISQR